MYTLSVILKSVRQKYEGSIFLLTNIVLFSIMIFLDILSVSQVINFYISLSYIGIIIFTFSLNYLILSKFIKSFKTIEKLSEEFNLEKPLVNLNQKSIFNRFERELKKIKENEINLDKILHNIPFIIIETDTTLKVKFLNQAAREILHTESNEEINLGTFLSKNDIDKLTDFNQHKDFSNLLVLNLKNKISESHVILSKVKLSFEASGKIDSIRITGIDIQNAINRSFIPEEVLFREYNFSKREKEVLSLLIKGNKIKEIAQKLFISEATVKEHLSSIYAELNVKNKLELFEKLKEYQKLDFGYDSFIFYFLQHIINT